MLDADPSRAAETPFGGTIAQGFSTAWLLAPIAHNLIHLTDASTSINYGLEKLDRSSISSGPNLTTGRLTPRHAVARVPFL